MAAINFPSSPSNGDTHVVGGVTYTYNSAETKWKTTINSNAFLPLSGGTVSGNILMGGEIQHDGDTDTNISFDTDTILFDTAGSERFRVGSAGQLGIGGATYGTSGQVLTSGGASAAPSWAAASNLTRGTAVDTTSGTQIDFTNLPTGIRKITLVLDQVSVSTTNNIFVRLSTGGTFATTGYESQSMSIQDGSTSASVVDSTQFVIINNLNATLRHSGSFTWHNITGNTWVMSGNCNSNLTSVALVSGGSINLGGELDGLRFRIAGGTFDAGQINILYEV